MKPGIPWSVKGIEPEVREAAKHAARRAGMTLGEWLNTVILDQNDHAGGGQPTPEHSPAQDYFSREPERPASRREEPQRREESVRWEEPPRREQNSIRLEDIAQQLSQLAQRERESATIMPYEPPRGRNEERDALDRILNRIDSNERQSVEAFTAVNERLSVLGRQIAMAARPQALEKPEDVPGFPALEAAIRNVVEHIEVSEKRTRDTLKAMQDRLGDMAERATHPANPDDLVRSAPAFASLEARIAEMSARMVRSEHHLQSGLPEIVRNEINQLADRIESVKASAETLASQAQSSAVGVARNELREIETRILGVLKEAQTMIGGQQSAVTDVQRLRGEISGLNKRIDEVKSATATERDVHALRVSVEQLSTRVAQGPDTRPLADMDRRLGDLTRKLDQNNAAARNLPQFGELERRIAELDHRLGEAMRLQGDHQAVEVLEQHLAAVNERVGRTEEQLGHLETMEQAIHQLYQSLEQNRAQVSQTAEEAANRAVERVLAAQSSAGPSPELRAMEEGLRAVRESAASAEQRNQETLEAVHETLEQIVSKLAELETASAGHQLAANMAHQAAEQVASAAPVLQHAEPVPPMHDAHQQASAQFYDPTGAFDQQVFAEPQPQHTPPNAYQPHVSDAPDNAPAAETGIPRMPDFGAMPGAATQHAPDFSAGAPAPAAGDDFIAAARRAAQAAAMRPSALHPELKTGAKPDPVPAAKKGFSLPFLKGKEEYKPITYVNGQPVVEPAASSANDNKRKKLVLAGIVLLAAVSAFAFNMLAKPKGIKQTTAIEAPVNIVPGANTAPAAPAKPQILPDADKIGTQSQNTSTGVPVDMLATGSLPAKKTDATLSSIVAEPSAARAEMPPPEAGPQALREAAARGDAKAQFIIASRYLDGQSVAQDLPKAAYWYQQAASRGLAPAQYRLATLFERGKGAPQDVATALLWYERAAEGGNLKAMHNAAVIAAGNQAGTPNYDKAFRWFLAAAEQGLQDSQFNLAVLFERGLGTRVDKQEAFFWYTLAARQGDSDAAKRAETLARTISGAEAASTSARVAAWSPIVAPDDANVVAVADPSWNDQPAAAAAPAPSIMDSDAATPMMMSTPEPRPTASPTAQAQELLTTLGYNVGTPDGKMGGRTANAIRLFQLQWGLNVTGEVTPELLDVMREKAG